METNEAGMAKVGMTGRLDPIGKLFSDTWQMYTAKLDTLLQIVAIPAVIVTLGMILLASRAAAVLSVLGGLLLVVGVVTFIFGFIALLVSVVHGTDMKESYRRSPKFFWPLVWVSILLGVVMIGGFVMLIVPAIMMGVWFMFSRYLVIAEDRRGLNALVQSREYARGFWWALFGRTILMGIAIAIPSAIVVGILTALLGPVLAPLGNLLVWLFAIPFGVVYPFVMYKNLMSLKPELATTQATQSRTFIKVSGIIGIVGLILIPFIIISIIGFVLAHSRIDMNSYYSNLPAGSNWAAPTSTATGTYQY